MNRKNIDEVWGDIQFEEVSSIQEKLMNYFGTIENLVDFQLRNDFMGISIKSKTGDRGYVCLEEKWKRSHGESLIRLISEHKPKDASVINCFKNKENHSYGFHWRKND